MQVGVAEESSISANTSTPFVPRATLIRYWNKEIRNDIPISPFILSKASPLNAVQSASFSKLASSNSLGTQLQSFCSSAKLFCFPDVGQTLEKHDVSNRNNTYGAEGQFNTNDLVNSLIKINYLIANPKSSQSNVSQTPSLDELKEAAANSMVNKWAGEPAAFFREKMLKKGTVMPMPDIKDKMPKRSFLPRSITSKLPFSTSKIGEIKEIFHAGDNSTTEKIMKDVLEECERAPSAGEMKRCVGSAEDLIDFVTSVLGRNITVRTTDNAKGSKANIMVGEVKGINGGMVTKSVSCHQILYPYLLYYCHSVPNVRVYEADILDPTSKAKINHGVAICHVDTSAWTATHVAFLELGYGPGRIEVCHWIYENGMTWTIAD